MGKIQRKKRGIFRELIKAILLYSSITVVNFLVILGICTLYDSIVGDNVPDVIGLGVGSPFRTMAFFNSTSHLKRIENLEEISKSNLFNDLQSTLSILDEVCPEVADWTRERFSKNKVLLRNDGVCVAKYNYSEETLILSSFFFAFDDGVKASILAHEFRHSRQNFCKRIIFVMSCIFSKDPLYHVIEDDAYLFEKEVLVAVFL